MLPFPPPCPRVGVEAPTPDAAVPRALSESTAVAKLTREERQARRAKAILDIAQPPSLDTVLAGLAGITSMIPIGGSVMATALTEWRQEQTLRRLAEFILDVHEDLQALEDERDEDLIRQEEFRRMLEAALESATQAHHAGKRAYYAAAVARTATHRRPPQEERDLMLDTLDALRPIHLAIFAAVAADPEPASASAYLNPGTDKRRAIEAAVPGVSTDLFARCWEDLARVGVFDSLTLVTDDGLTAEERQKVSAVTPFGRRFIDFISPP